ncbi:hypothetical protein EK904_001541 [Melospiza melodia maxima]|nr:hypothetical protein EK904_001541 [Melospiza melodia maxima]
MNGGLCITPGLCICPPGFYGINCDKGKCHQPCRNGGKCTGKNKCKCSKGYQGDLCSKPVCEPSCGLYGTCVEPNKCQCKEGWHGRHCNKKLADHHECNPPGMGVTDVNPRLSDSLAVLGSLGSLARPSIRLSGRTLFVLRGNRRVSTFVRQSKILCSNGVRSQRSERPEASRQQAQAAHAFAKKGRGEACPTRIQLYLVNSNI